MMVANLCNYFFQVTMGRLLPPADYGTLNALLSLFIVLSVFSSLFSMAMARETAYYHALGQDNRVRQVVRILFRLSAALSALFLLLGTLASAFIARLLQIDNPLLVVFTVLVVAVSGLYPVFTGLLQGLKRFVPFSLTGVLVSAVKLVLGVGLVALGWRLYGALAALFISGLAALVFCLFQVSGYCRVTEKTADVRLSRRLLLQDLNSVFWVQTMTVAVTNCDILLVKAFALDAAEAGVYASGMVIGKIAMYVASAVVAALFPLVAEARAHRQDPRPLFLKAMLYGGGIALLCTLGLNVFGGQIIGLLFGNAYLAVLPLLLPIGVLVLAITFVNIQMNYLIALKRTRVYAISLGVGCAAIAGLLAFFHSGTAQILYLMAAVLYTVFLVNLSSILRTESAPLQAQGGSNVHE